MAIMLRALCTGDREQAEVQRRCGLRGAAAGLQRGECVAAIVARSCLLRGHAGRTVHRTRAAGFRGASSGKAKKPIEPAYEGAVYAMDTKQLRTFAAIV